MVSASSGREAREYKNILFFTIHHQSFAYKWELGCSISHVQEGDNSLSPLTIVSVSVCVCQNPSNNMNNALRCRR